MRSVVILVVVLIVGILGTYLTLGAMGKVQFFWEKDAGQLQPGYVRIPISSQPIPSYSKVNQLHLIDGRTGAPTTRDVPEAKLEGTNIIRTWDEIVGRVLNRDKAPGFAFTEDDFMPEGTSPGIAAGVPPGMRAVVLSTDAIIGAHELQQNDRVDLLVYVDSKTASMATRNLQHLLGADARVIADDIDVGAQVVVNNGLVIRPVTERAETYKHQGGLTGGNVSYRQRTIEEITIAVDPQEAVQLIEALSRGVRLLAVVRSGLPGAANQDQDIRVNGRGQAYIPGQSNGGEDENGDSMTLYAEEIDADPAIVIESIVGKRREDVVFTQTVR